MKTSVAFAALLIALNAPGLAFAQTTAPASSSQTTRPGSGATRDLNSLPPAAVAPAPATPAARTPAAVATPRTAPAAAAPRQTTPAPTPGPSSATAPTAEAAPEPPVMTVLNPAAVAALPFTVELPAGFRITTGRPGPNFNIYTIRRGVQSFVTVYAGPASQFPIYTGETVQAGGRASIVVPDQAGQRHALEHLFQRATAPREIHIWTSSLEGADQALAEQIAQSVDDR